MDVFNPSDREPVAGKVIQSPRFTSLFKPKSTRQAEIIDGEPADIAAVVVKKILEVS